MTPPQARRDDRRWRPRPVLSFALRFVSVLVPAAAGVASAFVYIRAVPAPDGSARIPWLLGVIVCSTAATALAERIGKRFLPLAMLLRLSLVFPDKAPSRFAMARGAGSLRVLERRIHDARERGVDPAPIRAAEQILGLVAALSAHDRRTRGHSERVRVFTDLIATQLRLPDDDRDRLRWAALLHDIGKIRVPARILNKPGPPAPHEWETLKGHPRAGARIARPLMDWLGAWGHAIEQHHERWDGAGYPTGNAGAEISLGARIVSVADSFEVMTAPRSYRKPLSVPAARRELAECAGGQFDPAVVRAFLQVSLGRLWWTVGPTSWAAVVPVLGEAQRAGGQVAAAAQGAAAAVAVGVAGFLPIFGGTAAAAPDPGRAPAASVRADGGIPAADGVRSGHGEDPDGGAGSRSASPGDDGRSTSEEPPSDDGAGDPGGNVDPDDPRVDAPIADAADRLDRAVDGAVDTADDVVDGVIETVDGVADGATDLVDGVVGGSIASDVPDEPVDDVTDLLGGLLGG